VVADPLQSDLLSLLAQRSAQALTAESGAAALLRSAGITDPATWAAFRLGAGGDSLAAGLDPNAWEQCKALGLRRQSVGFVLAGPGINIPTVDPRDPGRTIGFVRILPAQAKHRFATAPAGIACAADIGQQLRVVLVDAPLLALRLHQAGVRGVALVEDPVVLVPLQSWLAERQVFVVSQRKAGLAALVAALGPIGGAATPVQVQGDLGLSSDEALDLLGLDRGVLQPAEPAPAASPQLLHHLLAYAQGRLATSEGLAALDVFGANQPELVATYRLGYLPADFRAALDGPTKRLLTGLPVGNSIIIPAFDREGVVVDLLMKYAGTTAHRAIGLHAEPQGMLAPVIATAYDEIIVTTSVWSLCRLWKAGHRNVLLFRSAADAHRNASRLRESGVQIVHVHAVARARHADVAQAMGDAGFRVQLMGRSEAEAAPTQPDHQDVKEDEAAEFVVIEENDPPPPLPFPTATMPTREPLAPEPPPAAPAPGVTAPSEPPAAAAAQTTTAPVTDDGLTLVEHDEATGLATFRAGTAIYVVDVPWDSSSFLEVSLRHNGQVHRDRFDVAVEAQRRRFASSAALRTAVAMERIEPHLIALLDAVRALTAAPGGPAQSLALADLLPSDRAAALDHLAAPDLMQRIRDDLSDLGWVGEDDAKTLLYLAATSRKLASPVWASLMASPGAGKSHGLDLIAELMPPEDLVQVSRLTDAALYYQDQGGLAHKLLIVDEADALSPDVIVALRVLKTRGALSLSHADRSGPSGQVRTKTIEARGPVAVLTSTAGTLEPQLLSRCVEVPVDESPAQTQRILAAQQRLHADPSWLRAGGRREAILARHRTMQRLLASLPVVIPFAQQIEFPATSVRHRREHERFLGLIEASALLHQHQRLKDRGTVIATEADFHLAASLVARELAAAHQGLGQHARSLLDLLVSRGVTTATMEDLAALRPEWSRYTFRAALTELMALDFITSPGGGRGKRREYRLAVSGGPTTTAPGVRLRPVGELATVGEPRFTNTSPSASAG
jgi:hypothetical protein